MSIQRNIKRGSESGNALFLILIAVALFAALSYAVTQSGRGSGTIDKETALIAAAQTTQYPAALRSTITRMVITGTPVAGATGIDFGVPSGQTYEVFDPSGGGAVFQKPPANIGNASGDGQAGDGVQVANQWGFLDAQHATTGFYIKGVGSDADTAGREIIAYLHQITLAVCNAINKGLGYTNTTPYAQGTAVNLTIPDGALAGAAVQGTGTANVFAAASSGGVAFSCIRNGGADYDYYHALVEQ